MEDTPQGTNGHSAGKMSSKALHVIGWVIVGVLFALLFALGFGFLVQWIWNAIMPEIFGLGRVGFWQAVGIVVLAKLLFGRVGVPRHNDNDRRYRHEWPAPRERHVRDPGGDVKTRYRNWRDYHQFWREEGKAAFESYVKRKKAGNQQDAVEQVKGPYAAQSPSEE